MVIHYMYVAILFQLTKAVPIFFERVITYYQTLQTWIGYDATHYLNFNALPHALPYIFFSLTWLSYNAAGYHNFNVLPYVELYIFSTFSMVWGYLQRVTVKL